MQSMPETMQTLDNRDEQSLLQRIAEKDRVALTRMYEVYHSRLFKFVFRLTNSHAIADELVNDIMLVVWQKAGSFRGDSRVSTWIFGIAYRVTMRRVTKKKMTLVSQAQLEEIPHEDILPVEIEDWVRRGIDGLPEAQQITVMLVFYLGLSYDEIAEVTECPVNTVKTRMFHARRKLKTLLTDSAIPVSTLSEK
ncbi:MAG: RNA polymerase sigma factor [Woeseiaceae bacterium]